jgi:putative CocE/NonD family hydrolase
VAEQPFCDGNVGMYGFSYGGATQVQAAVRRPPGLKAIAPALTGADYYEGWAYSNGAFSLAFNASWATMLAMDIARREGRGELEHELLRQFASSPGLYDLLPLTDYPNLSADGPGAFFQDWLRHETKDDYWAKWDVTDRLPAVEPPALVVGGLYDVFLESTLRVYAGLSARAGTRTSLVLTPWYHIPWSRFVGGLDFGPDAASRLDALQLAFFGSALRGDDVPEGPTVSAFVTGRNAWTSFEAWPPAGDTLRLHLHGTRANSLNGDGSLSLEAPGTEPADSLSYDPAFPVPALGGRSCCFPNVAPMGAVEQTAVEVLNGVLVYTSEPLERDLLVAGRVLVRLWAETSEADADWVVRVCDVSEHGSFNVAEGIRRARFNQGTDAARLIPPGEVTRFEIASSCCHLFRAGHRIRLHVTSSAFPLWDRNLNTGNPVGTEPLSARRVAIQTVHHDADAPSCLELPVLS